MTNPDDEQQVLEAAREISDNSPNHPVQVAAIAQATGLSDKAIQSALKALYDRSELREIIGQKTITAVSLSN